VHIRSARVYKWHPYIPWVREVGGLCNSPGDLSVSLLTFYLLDGRLKAMKTHVQTAQQIIEIALKLMIERGYNAFSYADITDRLEIRKASIHYHFPNKSDLGRAVVAYYRTMVQQWLNQIDQASNNPRHKLDIYIEHLYKQMREANFFCLCTLFSAELPTLPESVRDEVQGYFREHAAWFATLLASGREQGIFTFRGDPTIKAQSVLAAIQGAMIAARAYQDPEHFRTIALQVSSDLHE
jgi:TetR/AcrR family transcriptional repressor of nem operon